MFKITIPGSRWLKDGMKDCKRSNGLHNRDNAFHSDSLDITTAVRGQKHEGSRYIKECRNRKEISSDVCWLFILHASAREGLMSMNQYVTKKDVRGSVTHRGPVHTFKSRENLERTNKSFPFPS